MISRRNAIKALLLVSTAVISFFLIDKWLKIISLPDLSLLHKKKSIIAEIAELIIPKTDTPGAKDAKVEEFIIGIIEFCSDRKTQNNFLIGLRRLEDLSIDKYGKAFLSCAVSEQLALLTHLENNALYQVNILNKIRNKLIGKPFIVRFKELAAEGYCTSYAGATKGLSYDYLPITYNACINLESNQRSWATR